MESEIFVPGRILPMTKAFFVLYSKGQMAWILKGNYDTI